MLIDEELLNALEALWLLREHFPATTREQRDTLVDIIAKDAEKSGESGVIGVLLNDVREISPQQQDTLVDAILVASRKQSMNMFAFSGLSDPSPDQLAKITAFIREAPDSRLPIWELTVKARGARTIRVH